MSAFPSAVQTSLGRTFHLAKQIGKGSEGAVYEAKEENDIALKLYWPDKALSRRDKIAAMASAQWYRANSFVAFPIDVLFSPAGAFVGFIMKKVDGSKPVHMLYSPASRKAEFTRANFKFLVRAAGNIARAVASVHATGCVIGDVNHSGVLVSNQATSTLIDSDSFQVTASNNKFLCQVGTPEYTPPELQGVRFDRVARTSNHDNFGLAILVFQILFMGRHPFSGVYQGQGDMPLERAISEDRFAYSTQAATKMKPPPGAPLLTDFPTYIGRAFEKAFGPVGRTLRPIASEWVSLLNMLEGELTECASDSSHQHAKGKPCPWCRMEQTNPGFVAFTSSKSADIPVNIDMSQLAAIIRSIKDPGPSPSLESLIVVPANLVAATPASDLVHKLKLRAHVSIGASAAGAILIFFGGAAMLPGLVALATGLLTSIGVPKELARLRGARSQADSSWHTIQDAWAQHSGNQTFLEAKRTTDELIRSFADLPNEEKRRVQQLEQKKREAQLHRYLDRFIIAHAKIPKIGSGRKAVLSSFGIETAADVEQYKIAAIQGFGPTLIASLMDWRQNLTKKFVFNASEPINQSDLAALRFNIYTQKIELDKKIRASVANLQQASNLCLSQRAKLASSANQAVGARKQAELNELAATGPLYKASKIISLCCAVLAAAGLMTGRDAISRAIRGNASVPMSGAERSIATSSNVAQSDPQQWPPIPATPPVEVSDQKWQMGSQVARQGETTTQPIPPPPPMSLQNPEMSAKNGDAPLDGSIVRNLSQRDDAIQVQRRLAELGFLSGSTDGKWGPRSKRALLEYKESSGLDKNDSWDARTERLLFSDSATHAVSALPFVGGWTLRLGDCGESGQPSPVRITAKRAETSGGACEFNSVRPDGSGAWLIDAKCAATESSHVAHIRLAVVGDVLHWTSEQPEVLYYRCSR
jgi:DNA-binding helix-hairpin-helix protein with protein kinase domain